MDSISIDDFSDAIMEQLRSYSDEIDTTMKKEIDKIAKEAKKEVESRGNYQDRGTYKDYGKYREGFALKRVANGVGYRRYKLSNKQYQLTHLLEYGHAINGGTGRTRAFPHWKYGQQIVDELPDRIKKAVEK